MSQTMVLGAFFSLKGTWTNGRPIITTFHGVVVPTGDRPTAIANCAARLNVAWATNILPLLPDNYSFSGCNWVDLATETGATGVAAHGPMTGGDVSSAGTPPNVGILVTKNFAGAGRNKRTGRVFLPGNLESLVDENGIISSGKVTQINTGFTSFLNAISSGAPPTGVSEFRLVVGHAPSIAHTVTKTVRKPDPDGVLIADTITTMTAQTLVSGIKARVGR